RVQVIVLIAVIGNQSIAPRVADNHFVHGSTEITPQPARQRSFFNDQRTRARHGLDYLQERWDRRVPSLTLDHLASRINHRNLTKQTMAVNADKMTTLHRGLHELAILAT